MWNEKSKIPGYSISEVSNLSAPKRVRYSCELTGLPAKVALHTPQIILYFVSEEDAILAWDAILDKILHLLVTEASFLKNATASIGSAMDREKQKRARESTRTEIISIAFSQAMAYRSSRKLKFALPGALYALKYAKIVHGPDSERCIPIYLFLGKLYIELHNTGKAHDFFSLAKWCCLKSRVEDPEILADLHGELGKIFMKQKLRREMIDNFSKNVYHATVAEGNPRSPKLIPNLFQLSDAFVQIAESEDDLDAAERLKQKALLAYDYIDEIISEMPQEEGDLELSSPVFCKALLDEKREQAKATFE